MPESLPSGWCNSTLGVLSHYVTSGSRDWSSYYASDGALFIRTQDINKNRLAGLDSIARVFLPPAVEGKRSLVQQGDVLITITGANVGRCAHIGDALPEAYVSQSVALVRLKLPSISRYVHYQLLAPMSGERTWLEANAYGMGRPVLSLENVRSAPISLAPLGEQQRIAEKLDAVFARVDACRDRLARVAPLLKRFRQSVLAAATSGRLTADWSASNVGQPPWRPVKLGHVASDFSYGSAAKSARAGMVPVLRMGNIQDGRLDWSALVFTSDPIEIEKYTLRSGDVLFNRTNSPELVGKTAVFAEERQAIYAGYLIRVRCLPELLPDYLNYCLGSPAGRAFCWFAKSDGVSQSNINATKLRTFDLLLPSVEEQAEIVRRVETLFAFADRLEARLARARTTVDRLNPSLLAKAFRGELVPQDPADEPAAELLKRLAAQREPAAARPRRKRAAA